MSNQCWSEDLCYLGTSTDSPWLSEIVVFGLIMVETDWIASKTADGSWCDMQVTDNNNIVHFTWCCPHKPSTYCRTWCINLKSRRYHIPTWSLLWVLGIQLPHNIMTLLHCHLASMGTVVYSVYHCHLGYSYITYNTRMKNTSDMAKFQKKFSSSRECWHNAE